MDYTQEFKELTRQSSVMHNLTKEMDTQTLNIEKGLIGAKINFEVWVTLDSGVALGWARYDKEWRLVVRTIISTTSITEIDARMSLCPLAEAHIELRMRAFRDLPKLLYAISQECAKRISNFHNDLNNVSHASANL
jgi:hypothetical protein